MLAAVVEKYRKRGIFTKFIATLKAFLIDKMKKVKIKNGTKYEKAYICLCKSKDTPDEIYTRIGF